MIAEPFALFLLIFIFLITISSYEAVKLGSTDTEEMALRRLNETQAHDHLKTDYCLKNQIKLIRIPYWEKENIETILLKEIS